MTVDWLDYAAGVLIAFVLVAARLRIRRRRWLRHHSRNLIVHVRIERDEPRDRGDRDG